MNKLFLLLIEQLNSAVFVLLILLAVVFYLAIEITKKITKWTTHNENRENNQKDKNKEFKGIFEKIEKKLEILPVLKDRVDVIYRNTPNAILRSESPLNLTGKGKEISDEIQAPKIFNKYLEELTSKFDENNLNAYDIQARSFKIINQYFKEIILEDELEILKNKAYNEGILLDDILSIFGILLRDKILKDKNIPVEDIDKHSPKEG